MSRLTHPNPSMSQGPDLRPRSHRAAARLVTQLAAAAVLIGAARAQDDGDTVFLRDGSTETGKVVEEGFLGATLQADRGRKVLPWSAVQAIEYFDAPEELGAGMATLGAGNLEGALEQLRAVLATEKEADLRPMIVQQALFHLAYAHQRLGHAAEATAAYRDLAGRFPKGRYLRLAAENLIDLHVAKGDASGAQAALDAIAAGAKGLEGFDVQVALLNGTLLERQGKTAEARERFAAVESTAGAPAEAVKEAVLGRARLLLREGKAAEAEPIFRGLVGETAPARVHSGAWNGLGEVLSVEGRAKRDSERILDALYAYLRTVVQYKPQLGESTEEYERAMHGAATCFQYLSELEQSTERKKLMRDRSRERLEQLKRDYPNSTFLKKT